MEPGEAEVPDRDLLSRPEELSLYRAGPKRVVPGRKGVKYVAEDWIEEETTRHRGPDE